MFRVSAVFMFHFSCCMFAIPVKFASLRVSDLSKSLACKTGNKTQVIFLYEPVQGKSLGLEKIVKTRDVVLLTVVCRRFCSM